MKMRSLIRNKRQAGFTLLEVLVVMAIIVVLATMTISIYSWLEARKNTQSAESVCKRVEMGLSAYHQDHDRYPYGTEKPFQNNGMAQGDGDELSSNVVYMALFGDYQNKGVPDKNATIYDDSMNPGTQATTNPFVREITLTNKAGKPTRLFILTDPWGTPYRYRLGSDQAIPSKSSTPKMGKGQNPDFDFWSFGQDGDGDPDHFDAPENKDNIGNLPKL